MASKIPPPSNVTKDGGRAAALAKALDDKKAPKEAAKKSLIDPLRDPSTYSADELTDMMKEGKSPPTSPRTTW